MYIFPCNQRQSGGQESRILTASSQEGVTYSFVIRQFNNWWASSWHLAEWHQQSHWTSDRQHFNSPWSLGRIATGRRKASNCVIQRQKGTSILPDREEQPIHHQDGSTKTQITNGVEMLIHRVCSQQSIGDTWATFIRTKNSCPAFTF